MPSSTIPGSSPACGEVARSAAGGDPRPSAPYRPKPLRSLTHPHIPPDIIRIGTHILDRYRLTINAVFDEGDAVGE